MATSVQIGDLLGSYRIVRLLGEGGMGAVYEAAHQQIGRRAAAKILTLDPRRYPNLYHRFVNEARAANQIKHPGVVQVFEFGQLPDGTPWMLMEFLEGHTLGAYLRAAWKTTGRPLGTDGLWIFHELATILSIAHENGIVHRDLKPGNVMLVHEPGQGERVKLLDFGIAKFMRDTLDVDDPSQHFTATGAMLGTPIYMAPEQCKSSAHVTGQADVYALGVMMYELYTGRPPFSDPMPLTVMAQKLADPALPLSVVAPDTPTEIVHLVREMLDREPGVRPSMPQVQARLATILQIPAARRSGFLQQVTPPPKLEEPPPRSTLTDPNQRPLEASGVDGAPPAPSSSVGSGQVPQRLPATSGPVGTLMPPTPPEHSAGQLARQPLALPAPPSLGQQPTHPQAGSRRALRWALLAAGAGLSVATTITLWPASRKVHPPVPVVSGSVAADMSSASRAYVPPAVPVVTPGTPQAEQKATVQPPDTGSTPAQLPAAAQAQSAVEPPAKKKSACVTPSPACFIGPLTGPQRLAFRDAIDEVDLSLCTGQKIVVSAAPKLSLSSVTGISRPAAERFFFALQAALKPFPLKADVTIQCRGK
jgi:serine/threonine-protein kinase